MKFALLRAYWYLKTASSEQRWWCAFLLLHFIVIAIMVSR